MPKELQIKFRDEEKGEMGVPEYYVKDLAQRLNVTEEKAVHIAIANLYRELFETDEDVDFPTAKQLRKIDKSKEVGETETVDSIKNYL